MGRTVIDSLDVPHSWTTQRTDGGRIGFLAPDGDAVGVERDYETGVWTVGYKPGTSAKGADCEFDSKPDARKFAQTLIQTSERRGVDATLEKFDLGGSECPGKEAKSLAEPLTVRDAVDRCPFCGGPTGDTDSPSAFRCERSGNVYFVE